ncbi:sensor histidine kinase [Actimicrobium antarcticum]|uniref:histidine kinase n=1 Tax=Actimicrobium antarcticum TaxID=1051899 RepID=A0ABP7T2F1_9BURK
MNSLFQYFSSDNYMPHGHCYLWEPMLLWLHVGSDALIAAAYFTIPLTLIAFVRCRKDLQFHWMFLCFAVFILACGTSHLMEIWTVWHPDYWLSGAIKAVTALASIPTAFLLMKLVPLALALPSPAALAASNEELRREIDDRIRAENMLSQKNLELNNLNEELKAFSYSVSHDLRGPLRSMDGFSLALLEDHANQLDTDGQDALQRIRMASQRMGKLIDDLLRLSEVGRAELHGTQVDLSQLCTAIAASLVAEQPQRQVAWVIQPNVFMHGDRALLQIMLQNLLENAWKFTSKTVAAEIRFGATMQQGRTVYFVADNGAGFDPGHMEKIFDAFQRLHSVTDFPGTGIGLALVHRIIRRHGAEIWATAEVGCGATFHFGVQPGQQDHYAKPH